jgi:hypothetical protein
MSNNDQEFTNFIPNEINTQEIIYDFDFIVKMNLEI